MDIDEAGKLVQDEKEPRYRAGQLLDWLYKKRIASLAEAENLPAALRENISRRYQVSSLEFQSEEGSLNRESRKFLFRTQDGRLLESVLISQRGRKTICVSTQLGCKIGCTFCASGKGTFGRNLTAGEIIEQVIWIEKKLGKAASNIVFMGMGEPLDNFEATMKSLGILQAKWGLGLGGRHITVSTSGITPKILEFVKRNEGRVRLSVSIHSSLESKRSELVPINKRYPIGELVKVLHEVHKILKRKLTFEYTLIKGQNDSDEEAIGMAKMAALQMKK